jgi:hypothetical protein
MPDSHPHSKAIEQVQDFPLRNGNAPKRIKTAAWTKGKSAANDTTIAADIAKASFEPRTQMGIAPPLMKNDWRRAPTC